MTGKDGGGCFAVATPGKAWQNQKRKKRKKIYISPSSVVDNRNLLHSSKSNGRMLLNVKYLELGN